MTPSPQPREGAPPLAVAVLAPRAGRDRDAVVSAIEGAGFEIAGGLVHHALDGLQRAADTAPTLVVLDIGQAGAFGVRLVPMFRSVSPGAVVYVLTPLDSLGAAALVAGADEVFLDVDLRGFRSALRTLGLRSAPHPA